MPEAQPTPAGFDVDAALEELERSGQSVAAIARERGIPMWKLYDERQRRRRGHVARRKAAGRTEFVRVRVASEPPASTAFEVELRGGRTIRVPGSFDEDSLRRLVAVLEGC